MSLASRRRAPDVKQVGRRCAGAHCSANCAVIGHGVRLTEGGDAGCRPGRSPSSPLPTLQSLGCSACATADRHCRAARAVFLFRPRCLCRGPLCLSASASGMQPSFVVSSVSSLISLSLSLVGSCNPFGCAPFSHRAVFHFSAQRCPRALTESVLAVGRRALGAVIVAARLPAPLLLPALLPRHGRSCCGREV